MTQEKYFQREELFFDFWTKEFKEIMSKMHIGSWKHGIDSLGKNMKVIYKDSYIHDDGRELIKEIIYLHSSGFYIYLSKKMVAEINFVAKIFYKPEHYNEIMMFLNAIKKHETVN